MADDSGFDWDWTKFLPRPPGMLTFGGALPYVSPAPDPRVADPGDTRGAATFGNPLVDPTKAPPPAAGPGAQPDVTAPGAKGNVVMPDGGPGLLGFTAYKFTGNEKKEKTFNEKLLEMVQDKNFTGALDALGLGGTKAPQGSPPKIPHAHPPQTSALSPPDPTLKTKAQGLMSNAQSTVDLRAPLQQIANPQRAPTQGRYSILGRRQQNINDLLKEIL